MKYLYRAKNTCGDIATGSLVASDEVEAEAILQKNSMIMVDIEPAHSIRINSFFNRFPLREKMIFTRQLSTMVSAGIAAPKAIAVIATQTQNEFAKSVYYHLIDDLEQGLQLSVAMSKYPNHFSQVMISVIRSGEQTGQLDEVLNQLAKQLERDNMLSSKVRNAMIYPAIVILAMLGIGIFMMIFVIPKFKAIFASAKVDLPWSTQALIGFSDSVVSYWYFYFIVLVFLVLAVRAFLISDYGRYFFDELKLKIPVFSKVVEGVYMARFSQTLAMMNKSGVPILESIKIISTVMDNQVYNEGLRMATAQVERGLPLSSQLSKNPNFPVLVSQMIGVGEQTGQLEGVMDKLGKFYEEETDEKIKGLASLIEPVVMILLGIGVAFIVISVITPIYKIAQIQ